MKPYPPLTRDEQNRLLASAQAGDLAARDRLLLHNTGLICHWAKRFSDRSGSLDDAIQDGYLVLVRCIKGFKPEMGLAFSTYASFALKHAYINRRNKLNRLPMVDVDSETAYKIEPFVEPADYDQPAEFRDRVGRVVDSDRLQSALDELSKREVAILQARCRGKRFEILALRFGVCKERIRQIEMRGLEKLAERIGTSRQPIPINQV